MIARIAVAFAIVAPWLGLSFVVHDGLTEAACAALTLAAACHGAGIAGARLVGRPLDGVLATAWGMAILVALAGSAMLLDVRAQLPLVYGFAAVHSLALARRFREHADRLRASATRWWLVVGILLAAFAVLHVLGGAGDVGVRPFDDDGRVTAQVRRLLDTGTLGDGIGYARTHQLGGQVALEALAASLGGVHLAGIVDGIAFVLLGLLVCTRLPVGDAPSAIWAALALLVLSALAIAWPDVTLLWVPVVLIVALAWSAESVVALGLVAGALVALRLELAPIALALLLVGVRRRAWIAVAVALAAIAPYLVVRWFARGIHPPLAAVPITWARVVWPLVIALGTLVFVRFARRTVLACGAMIATFVACLLIYDGREAHSHIAWGQRYVDRLENIEYLRDTYARPTRDPAYERLIEQIPGEAVVALWLDRPERIDYRRRSFIDARVPPVAGLPHPGKWLAGLHVTFLLVEHPEDLDSLVRDHRVIASVDGVSLVDLSAARSN